MDILDSGLLENEEQFAALAERYGRVILPGDDEEDITHWWALRDGGEEALYAGNPATFATYVRERNGGVQ